MGPRVGSMAPAGAQQALPNADAGHQAVHLFFLLFTLLIGSIPSPEEGGHTKDRHAPGSVQSFWWTFRRSLVASNS
eukprot:64828-Prymnesium_polylepis.1